MASFQSITAGNENSFLFVQNLAPFDPASNTSILSPVEIHADTGAVPSQYYADLEMGTQVYSTEVRRTADNIPQATIAMVGPGGGAISLTPGPPDPVNRPAPTINMTCDLTTSSTDIKTNSKYIQINSQTGVFGTQTPFYIVNEGRNVPNNTQITSLGPNTILDPTPKVLSKLNFDGVSGTIFTDNNNVTVNPKNRQVQIPNSNSLLVIAKAGPTVGRTTTMTEDNISFNFTPQISTTGGNIGLASGNDLVIDSAQKLRVNTNTGVAIQNNIVCDSNGTNLVKQVTVTNTTAVPGALEPNTTIAPDAITQSVGLLQANKLTNEPINGASLTQQAIVSGVGGNINRLTTALGLQLLDSAQVLKTQISQTFMRIVNTFEASTTVGIKGSNLAVTSANIVNTDGVQIAKNIDGTADGQATFVNTRPLDTTILTQPAFAFYQLFNGAAWSTATQIMKMDLIRTISGGPQVPTVTINGNLVVTGDNSLTPTGMVTPYAGKINTTTDLIPAGWLLCDGSIYDGSNPLYSKLYFIIQNVYNLPYETYGPNQFSVPDLRTRVPVGAYWKDTAILAAIDCVGSTFSQIPGVAFNPPGYTSRQMIGVFTIASKSSQILPGMKVQIGVFPAQETRTITFVASQNNDDIRGPMDWGGNYDNMIVLFVDTPYVNDYNIQPVNITQGPYSQPAEGQVIGQRLGQSVRAQLLQEVANHSHTGAPSQQSTALNGVNNLTQNGSQTAGVTNGLFWSANSTTYFQPTSTPAIQNSLSLNYLIKL